MRAGSSQRIHLGDLQGCRLSGPAGYADGPDLARQQREEVVVQLQVGVGIEPGRRDTKVSA
jgi:hypothetical protein